MTEIQFRSMLESLGFNHYATDDTYSKHYGDIVSGLTADFKKKELRWPKGLTVSTATTSNFSQSENFVVFECVHRLLEMGYLPKDIELEPKWKVGHGASGGRADIWVRTRRPGEDAYDSLLIIECKTFGREFNAAWKDTLEDGDQLFGYFAQEPTTKFLCLYASEYENDKLNSTYHLINVQDNAEYLKTLKSPASFENGKSKGRRALFKAWKETYKLDYATIGLFENGIATYHPGKTEYTVDDLKSVDAVEIGRTYHRFAEILRKYNVSGRENAFDKLVNLMLAKVVDELQNRDKLLFNWKGAAYDDDYRLQDRLQRLYKEGMQRFLGEDVTYIDDKQVNDAFHRFKNDPDATRAKIQQYFRQLKFFTNNDFAFIDVHNEKLFNQNAIVLREVVQMLQDMRLRTETENQFLGDLFENFLDQGVKQSEGQFFTPIPFVRFMVSSLPIAEMIDNLKKPPVVLDYACGAGHFLNEYARQASMHLRVKEKAELDALPKPVKPTPKQKQDLDRKRGEIIARYNLKPYFEKITGIEKEYRLSKVSKVAAFMYGQDDINIIYTDGLLRNDSVKDGTVNLIIANPPYSVKGFLETIPEERRKEFTLSEAVAQITSCNSIECFFVERAAQLLAPGGIAAIILPSSILNNGNIYIACRDILLANFDVVAIVEMGNGTFGKTNTSTATLFLRRKKNDDAEHVRNRVECWFKADFSKDEIFKDADVRTRYAAVIGVNEADYDAFLKGEPTQRLLESDLFKQYRDMIISSSKAKSILKKKLKANYSAADRKNEFEAYVAAEIRRMEAEKLRVFMLADQNPQPVIIVKGPSKTSEFKNFLGYEWSTRKGAEGLHILGTDDADEDGFKGGQDIEQIKTPLFNPMMVCDPSKICTLIHQNYLGGLTDIPEELSEFVSVNSLSDMIDFSLIQFDKSIQSGRMQMHSKWEGCSQVSTLFELAPYVTEHISVDEIVVDDFITTDNMLQNRDGVVKCVEKPQISSAIEYKKGDVLVSNIRPYLKKIWLADRSGACSPDVLVFRSTGLLHPMFLYLILSDDDFFAYMMAGKSGLKMPRGDKDAIKRYLVPLPSMEKQKKLVAECEKIDKKIAQAKKDIETERAKIEGAFDGMKGRGTVKLASLCKIINPPKSEVSGFSDETIISFVEMASLSNDGGILQSENRKLGDVRKGGYTYFAENDVIIAKITPCMENGKCALARGLANNIGFGSSEYHVFRVNDGMKSEYLYYFLNRSSIRKAAEKVMTGASGHKRVPIAFYEKLAVPKLSDKEQVTFIASVKASEDKIVALKQEIEAAKAARSRLVEDFLK